jgi:hypothetical protein
MITREWLDEHLPADRALDLAETAAPDFRTMLVGKGLSDALRWLAALHEADRVPRPKWKDYDPEKGVHPETAWPIRIGGLGYKGNDSYLTAEGWPLGTTCWYVKVECGWREYIAAEEPEIAALRGVFYAAVTREWRDTHPDERTLTAQAHAEIVAARTLVVLGWKDAAGRKTT